jgi:hypothetical protein
MKSYITAIIIAVAIIVGGVLAGKAYNYKFKTRNTVSVVGSAEHNFVADLIVWSGAFTRTSMDMKEAYASLKNDEQQVRSYLSTRGIEDKEVIFSSISIDRQFNTSYDENGRQTGNVFTGYQLRQTVKIESKSMEKVANLKIDLLAKASSDAHERAETTAKNAHSTLGKLRRASMGVFQITGQYSNEDYSYGGSFNTSSKNKTASITVRLEYELE